MQDTLTIREMCDAFEVTPRTLRFYEAKELLSPIREGQKRLFTRRDRARLKLILRGKRFGFSLEEIRQLLDLYGADGDERPQIEKAYELGRKRLAELKAERERFDGAISELEAQLDWAGRTLDGKRAEKASAA
ncbi:MerR family DNA-binding transcriptional regulator [Palleronia sediminis]|uniref:MerR family DNA-binding transcriptional regulator n=2 Tax=Palleronia sediminis TaxID=2547833 RepID=A0A4R6A0W6_9RHOB|nr:MerR family DNA-binding transcriptional regulator [Palleronia sediminis]TDL74223.1 MerR family DNA-binding transcriptional regulator [Palleronia sediminis]